MTNLGLDTAGASQGFELIPIGEKIEVTAYIQPGGVGDGGLLKRSAKGDCEGVNIVYIIQGGKFHDRKIFHFHILRGRQRAMSRPARSRGRFCERSLRRSITSIHSTFHQQPLRGGRAFRLLIFMARLFWLRSQLRGERGSPMAAPGPIAT